MIRFHPLLPLPQFVERLVDSSSGTSGQQYLPTTLFRMLAYGNLLSKDGQHEKARQNAARVFAEGLTVLDAWLETGKLSGWMVRPAFDRFTDAIQDQTSLDFEEIYGEHSYELLTILSRSLTQSFNDFREALDPKMFSTVAISFARVADNLQRAYDRNYSDKGQALQQTLNNMDATIVAARNRIRVTCARWRYHAQHADHTQSEEDRAITLRQCNAEMSRKYALYLANISNGIFTPETVDNALSSPRAAPLKLGLIMAIAKCDWFSGPHSSWIPWLDVKNAPAITLAANLLLTDKTKKAEVLHQLCLAWPLQTQLRSSGALVKLRTASALCTLASQVDKDSQRISACLEMKRREDDIHDGRSIVDGLQLLDESLLACYLNTKFIPETDMPSVKSLWLNDNGMSLARHYLFSFSAETADVVERLLCCLYKQVIACPERELKGKLSGNIIGDTLSSIAPRYKNEPKQVFTKGIRFICDMANWRSRLIVPKLSCR